MSKAIKLEIENQSLSQEGSEENYSSSESEHLLVQKAEELYDSLQKLKAFVLEVSEEEAAIVPTCVEEYCEKIEKYRLTKISEVLKIAEKRVDKMLRNNKLKRNWNTEDLSLLIWLISKIIVQNTLNNFEEMTKEHWKIIASLISGAHWQKCKFKWLSLKKIRLVSHQWSKIQAKLLSEVIQKEQQLDWKQISEKLYELNQNKNKVFRTAKQCREHWNCFLNPSIQKGPWDISEDQKLLELVQQFEGNKKWSEISKFMKGRTQNALKNRYNLLISRQKKLSGHLSEKRLLKICLSNLVKDMKKEKSDEVIDDLPEQVSNFSEGSFTPEKGEPINEEVTEPKIQNRQPILPTVIEPHRPSYSSYDEYNELMKLYWNQRMSGVYGQQSASAYQNQLFFNFLYNSQFQ